MVTVRCSTGNLRREKAEAIVATTTDAENSEKFERFLPHLGPLQPDVISGIDFEVLRDSESGGEVTSTPEGDILPFQLRSAGQEVRKAGLPKCFPDELFGLPLIAIIAPWKDDGGYRRPGMGLLRVSLDHFVGIGDGGEHGDCFAVAVADEITSIDSTPGPGDLIAAAVPESGDKCAANAPDGESLAARLDGRKW
jgi:hypothetical protein